MRICVYCASSAQAPPEYGAAAFELGQRLGAAGHTVVFGGGGVGSMKRLADGAHAVGGATLGVMPSFMRELELGHPGVQDFRWTRDMAERKAQLLANSDAVVALPGGCGTFEELLEAITLKRLGRHALPIVVVNQGGYYDPLLQQFERAVAEAFMASAQPELFTTVTEVAAVLDAIRDATHRATQDITAQ